MLPHLSLMLWYGISLPYFTYGIFLSYKIMVRFISEGTEYKKYRIVVLKTFLVFEVLKTFLVFL